MRYANVWLVLSEQALEEFKAKRRGYTVVDDVQVPYDGPMDDKTFKILKYMADSDNVQRMFEPVTVGPKTYILFSLYLPGQSRTQEALDYLEEKWPGHFIVVGAWWMDGRQAGTQWGVYAEDVLYTEDVLDTDGTVLHSAGDVQFAKGTRTGDTTGDPIYPVHAHAWRLMPPTITYDENGDELTNVPASSNADLQDINLLQGQQPRRFA